MNKLLFFILFPSITSFFVSIEKDQEIRSFKPDCVHSAKAKTSYKVIKTGYGAKILFSGGYSDDFIIEIDGSIYNKTLEGVYFVKDDFCNWESSVLVIDDEVYGVKDVAKV